MSKKCNVNLLMIGIILLLLASCIVPDNAFADSPTNQGTPEILPDWILELQPEPANRVTLEWFETDLMQEINLDAYEGSRPVELTGHRSNICIYLEVEPLLQSGDYLVEYPDVISRISLDLDDVNLVPKPDPYWEHVEILRMHPAIGPNTFSSSPFWICFPVTITPGIHQATIQFKQTDGTIKEYSWTFEITVR